MNGVVLVMKEGKGDVEFELTMASSRSLTAIQLISFLLTTASWRHRSPLILQISSLLSSFLGI